MEMEKAGHLYNTSGLTSKGFGISFHLLLVVCSASPYRGGCFGKTLYYFCVYKLE